MTPASDPYRTLGLPRGASLDDVKRAYRALAKKNHPDAAGPAALPRWLAIQAAYEQLVHGKNPARNRTTPTRPAAADPARTDATHRAYGGRAKRARTAPGSGGDRHRRARGPGRDGSWVADRTRRPLATRGSERWRRIAGLGPDGCWRRERGRGVRARRARPEQGDPRLDVVRRRRCRPVRTGLGRCQLVRHDERHLLDPQPEGVRGSPQARTGVPGTGPPGGRRTGFGSG